MNTTTTSSRALKTAKTHSMSVPRIALTPGEPAGIGPDIVIQNAQSSRPAEVIAICSRELLLARAEQLGLPLQLIDYDPGKRDPRVSAAGELMIFPVKLHTNCVAGQLDPGNAGYVLDTLDIALDLGLTGVVDAIVTGPVHKEIINEAGVAFTGHTEYLATACKADPVMMLANEDFRVALATTHLPLSEVSKAITAEGLSRVIKILHNDLQNKFGIAAPQILVCGLNPHAGEGGHLGMEEIDVITPTLDSLRKSGMQLVGPLPADTLFTEKYLDQADAVLAMYHDQGLPVLKFAGFGKAVNITLGLPIIRTSVDHGTALDLAGTGKASAESLSYAIKQALILAEK